MTASFTKWELAARHAMSERGIGYHAATPLIEDAKAHFQQSGHSPEQALGSPREFAAAAAASRPVATRAGHDIHGKTPGDYLSGAVFALGVWSVPGLVWAAISVHSINIPVTIAGLLGSVVFALCWVAALGVPGALRAAGRPKLAPWALGLGALLAGVAAAAFTLLPKTRLGTVPVVVFIAAALVICWLLTRPGSGPAAVPAPGPELTPMAGDNTAAGDAERWFSRLGPLLVGRFDIPPERAAELVRQARSHFVSSGVAPENEFGPVEQYATVLADSESNRRGPWWRTKQADILLKAVVVVLVAQLSLQFWQDGNPTLAIIGGILALVAAWHTGRLTLQNPLSKNSIQKAGDGHGVVDHRAGQDGRGEQGCTCPRCGAAIACGVRGRECPTSVGCAGAGG